MRIAFFFVSLYHENEDIINIISVIVAALPNGLQDCQICSCARVSYSLQNEGGHGAKVGQCVL